MTLHQSSELRGGKDFLLRQGGSARVPKLVGGVQRRTVQGREEEQGKRLLPG